MKRSFLASSRSITRINKLSLVSKTSWPTSTLWQLDSQLVLAPIQNHSQQTRLLVSSSSWSKSIEKSSNRNKDDDGNQHQQQQGEDRPVWSEEWKSLGLGASLVDYPKFPKNLMFVQVGFGVDQHGQDDATKASIRAVRNAIEFNSIPGVVEHVPGGRKEMLIHVKLGVPVQVGAGSGGKNMTSTTTMPVDPLQVAKVFPYGKLLPIDIVPGGLDFATGRLVEELGDTNDRAICVVACISIGHGAPDNDDDTASDLHTIYSTKDGH